MQSKKKCKIFIFGFFLFFEVISELKYLKSFLSGRPRLTPIILEHQLFFNSRIPWRGDDDMWHSN